MNIYKLTNNIVTGYDTYDSCIVCAENEHLAKTICPSGFYEWNGSQWEFLMADGTRFVKTRCDWCTPLEVQCEFIGTTDLHIDGTVLLASFNAG